MMRIRIRIRIRIQNKVLVITNKMKFFLVVKTGMFLFWEPILAFFPQYPDPDFLNEIHKFESGSNTYGSTVSKPYKTKIVKQQCCAVLLEQQMRNLKNQREIPVLSL